MNGIDAVDGAVLVAYLLGITALGVGMARRVHNAGDFFMPRRFGWLMMITHAFGTGTASDQAVIVASGTFKRGLSGIWYQWMWLFCTPFYWLIAPIMRRFRAVTTADVLSLRYDRSVAVLFAVLGTANLSVKIGLVLKVSAILVDASTGGLVNTNLAIALITVLFVLYGAAGGLGAAIVTDFIQGILTVIFSFMLLPFVLGAVGGMDGVRRSIQDPAMLSLVVTGLEIWMKIAPMMGIPIWLGLLWRRTTVAGAWTAAMVALGTWFLTTCQFFVDFAGRLPMADSWRLIWQEGDGAPVIYEPWKIIFYTVAATLSAIMVSLWTTPVAAEKLDRFYALTRTPIMPGEQVAEPCTLPKGVEPSPRRMALTALGLEIPMPSRTSAIGFAAGWITVAALIGGSAWIVAP